MVSPSVIPSKADTIVSLAQVLISTRNDVFFSRKGEITFPLGREMRIPRRGLRINQ